MDESEIFLKSQLPEISEETPKFSKLIYDNSGIEKDLLEKTFDKIEEYDIDLMSKEIDKFCRMRNVWKFIANFLKVYKHEWDSYEFNGSGIGHYNRLFEIFIFNKLLLCHYKWAVINSVGNIYKTMPIHLKYLKDIPAIPAKIIPKKIEKEVIIQFQQIN